MFGRRKSVMPKGRVKPVAPKPRLKPKPPAAKQAPVREPVRASHFSQHVLPIIVQQEEYDRGGADLVYAIVRYMNLMMEDGCYDPSQMPPHAMQSYHTDLYLAQVNNGGHSQFIGNGKGPHFNETVRNIHIALQAIGSQSYIKIFGEFLTWMKQNGRLAAQQTGFGDIPAALQDLDKRFFSTAQGLADLNAKWIESWKDLRVVSKESYKSEMQKLFESNPQKAENKRIREIRTVKLNLWESQKAKLNYVGFQSNTHVFVTQILPGNYQLIEGRSVPVFPIETSRGLLLGIFSDHWIGIYRAVKGDKPRSIHHVLNNELEKVGALISKHKAPAALHLLLKTWPKKDDFKAMIPNVNKQGQLAVVLLTKRAEMFIVTFGDQGARFYDPARNLISSLSHRDILAHSAASF